MESATALASADVLSELMPHNGRALDRLACLHYRRGELTDAVRVLSTWEARHPSRPGAVHHRAVIDRAGDGHACTTAVERALSLAR